MSRRGRPPKPDEMKLREGNPGKRAIASKRKRAGKIRSEQEPSGENTAAKTAAQQDAQRAIDLLPPSHLSPHAAAEWARIAPDLDRLGLLTRLDAPALCAYCESYSLWMQAKTIVAEKGMTFDTTSGQVKKRPEVGIMSEQSRIMRQFLVEFGMTPSASATVARRMAERGAGGRQPDLPMDMPEQTDPTKPQLPKAGAFTDDDHFGGRTVN